MVEKKASNKVEILILALIFLVFASIVIVYAGQWDRLDDESTYAVTTFQYLTSSKTDMSSIEGSKDGRSLASIGVVNINTATLEELDALPGIGIKKAEAIINYRETVSVFLAPEDILNVTGIGDKIYEEIKEYIVVE